MVRVTTQEQYSGKCEIRKWHGKNLFAIDGTTLALLDKPGLCKLFGASGRKKDSATANVSILYDIENDWIADAEISPYPTSEKKSAENHIKRLAELGNFSGYSPNAILQDFGACIHLANIVATAKAKANELVQLRQENAENIYQYVPNTAQLVGSLKDYFIVVCFLPRKKQRDAARDRMLIEISCAVSPIRPDRSIWRNPWPRKVKFCLNAKSNI